MNKYIQVRKLNMRWWCIVLFIGSIWLLVLMNAPTMHGANQTLFINEVMVSNASAILEPEEKNFSDWIEIYNAGSTAVDMSGMHLSDDPADLEKWTIPSGTIQPGGFLLFWADGFDTGKHTNFKLNHDGEILTLSDSGGTAIDTVDLTVAPQLPNVSYGRQTDGAVQWVYFSEDEITPDSSNNSATSIANTTLIVPAPAFSHPAGFYETQVTVSATLSDTYSAVIYYTLDGSIPDQSDTLYSGGIEITETTVLRARAYADGYFPSPVTTHTYFIDEGSTLPIISLSTDPDYFFDNAIGIYVKGDTYDGTSYSGNYYEDWERPIAVEFYEPDGTYGFGFDGGVQIHGYFSRRFDIKSLYVLTGNRYGSDDIQYKIFEDLDRDKFDGFLLRNSGSDYSGSYMKDGLLQSLVEHQVDIDTQGYRPAVVFLNGDYWGIHNIREKLNENYIEDNFGIDGDTIDMLKENKIIVAGDRVHYNALLDYIEQNGVVSPNNYAYVQTQMEIPQYMDYQIAEIYYAHDDWPHNNIRYWRPRTTDGRWRWVMYDLDAGFNEPTHNTIAWATDPASIDRNKPWSTFLLRKLLENQEFQDEFVQRFAAHAQITFEEARVISMIDELAAVLAPEMPRHIGKWSKPSSMNSWGWRVEDLRDFAGERQSEIFIHFNNHFALNGMDSLTAVVSPVGNGTIEIHDVPIPSDSFTGDFFIDVPIRLKAQPLPGYQFVEWAETGQTDPEITFTFTGGETRTAIFEPYVPPKLVINELHYNPAPAPIQGEDVDFEFIEIYNNDTDTVDLTGMRLTEAIEFTFPSASIDPGEYIVIASNLVPYQGQGYQVFAWGNELNTKMLSNSGETLKLENHDGNLIDIVSYEDDPALGWTDVPDGSGPSLELIAPHLENGGETAVPTAPQNWEPSLGTGGTPGRSNDELAAMEEHPIIINEIYYEPLVVNDDNNALEFVELLNRDTVPVDLSGYELAEGISYIFDAGTIIEPGEFIIIAKDSSYYTGEGYPFKAFTWDDGRLSNNGELIILKDAEGNWVDGVNYKTDNSNGWPIMNPAYSLEVIPAPVSNHSGAMWESSALIGGTPGRANNDDSPAIVIEDTTVQEGNTSSTIAFLRTTLSYAVPFDVSVSYAQVGDTAVSGEDFVHTTGSVTFSNWNIDQYVPVTIIGDGIFEPTETLMVELSDPVNGLIADGSAVLTIEDDDAPELSVSASQFAVQESTGVTATVLVTVSLDSILDVPTSFKYSTVSGSALADVDFQMSEGTVVLSAEKLQHVISVDIIGDSVDELDEEVFYLTFAEAQGLRFAQPSVPISIFDDDEPTVVFNAADISLTEGDKDTSTAVFPVSLSAATEVTVTVHYETVDGSALAGSDYEAKSGTVVFSPGQTIQAIHILLFGDEIQEGNEQFSLLFSQPSHVLLGDTEATAVIVNDDGLSHTAFIPAIVKP